MDNRDDSPISKQKSTNILDILMSILPDNPQAFTDAKVGTIGEIPKADLTPTIGLPGPVESPVPLQRAPAVEEPAPVPIPQAKPAAAAAAPKAVEKSAVNKILDAVIPQAKAAEPAADQELIDAQRSANLSRFIGNMMDAGSTMAGGQGNIGKNIIDGANIPVEQLQQLRKAQQEKLVQADENEKRDANSPISKAYRQFASEMGYPVPDSTTATQLEKLSPLFEKAFHNKLAREDKQRFLDDKNEYRKDLLDQRQKEALERAGRWAADKLENDSVLKEIRKQDLAFRQVDSLLKSARAGNQVSMSALGTKMARAMGEVGVLTETDVKRYVQARALPRKIQDVMLDVVRGTPSGRTLDDIESVYKAMFKDIEPSIQPIYDKYANRLARMHNIPIQDAYFQLDAPMPERAGDVGKFKESQKKLTTNNRTPDSEQTDTEEKVKVQLPDGRTGMIPKANLQKALAKGAKRL